MYSLADLTKEVTDKIESAKASGHTEIVADWIAHSVISDHPDLSGDDTDFYQICSYRTVRETTRAVMGAYDKNELKDSAQQILEGFTKLQTHYVVSRMKKQCMVHVDAMTFEELKAKANEHYAMQIGHGIHGDEIMRFANDKFNGLQASA